MNYPAAKSVSVHKFPGMGEFSLRKEIWEGKPALPLAPDLSARDDK